MKETLVSIRDFAVRVWEAGVFDTTLGQLLAGLGIFLAFLLLRQLFAAIVLRQLRALTERTRNRVDDAVLETLSGPLRFLFIVAGLFFAVEFIDLEKEYAGLADQLLQSLLVFCLFWAVYRAVRPLVGGLRALERVLNASMMDWLGRIAQVAVVAVGAATVLEIWGIKVGPIIAGAGLLGVAIALGAQDLFKNLIAGALILIEKRFHKGDWVLVDGVVEGTVEVIGFRSTLIRRFDQAPVHVPNAKLSDSSVTNFSRMTARRVYWTIGIEYKTSVDQLRQIRDGIESYILSNPEFCPPEAYSTFVRIDRFSDSSIDIMVYAFTKTTAWLEYMRIKEDLACAVKDIVEASGAAFAFPSRTLYIDHDAAPSAARAGEAPAEPAAAE